MTAKRHATGGGNVLLTGRPGIGKTTVVTRLCDLVGNRSLAGFYTEEIRELGHRQGFRVTTLSGKTAVLAHVSTKTRHRIGRYGVDLAAFEELVLPELARPADAVIIDEIGKMECFSPRFIEAVRALLDTTTPVVATVAISGGGFIAEVKGRPDVEIRQVTELNRGGLPRRLAEYFADPNGLRAPVS